MNHSLPPTPAPNHIPLNTHHSLIQIQGTDAHTFLHSQITQDIKTLAPNEVRLGAYCSAKGRMYATFYIWSPDSANTDTPTIHLLTHSSVATALIKRLRMFVLRAKVSIEDISHQHHISGQLSHAPTPLQMPHSHSTQNNTTYIGLPPAELNEWNRPQMHRQIYITPHTNPTPASKNQSPTDTTTDTPAETPEAYALWQWHEIIAGIAHISAANSEHFIPQMLNLDRIGGINFKKGCYPGQEIVARSHYLGKLKRRMHTASLTYPDHTPVQLHIGMDIHSDQDPNQAAGELIAYAPNPYQPNRWDILYEISLPLLDNNAQLSLPPQYPNPHWQHRPLPYTLSDPSA